MVSLIAQIAAGRPRSCSPSSGVWGMYHADVMDIDDARPSRFSGTYRENRTRECSPYTPRGSRILRLSSSCGSGSARRPRYSTSRTGSDAAAAERGAEPSFRSNGGARAHDPIDPAAVCWRHRPAYFVAGYRRSVPLTTISTWRLPQREQTSRSRQSSTGVSAPYRAAISARSGST
jgi:hypothetical protein